MPCKCYYYLGGLDWRKEEQRNSTWNRLESSVVHPAMASISMCGGIAIGRGETLHTYTILHTHSFTYTTIANVYGPKIIPFYYCWCNFTNEKRRNFRSYLVFHNHIFSTAWLNQSLLGWRTSYQLIAFCHCVVALLPHIFGFYIKCKKEFERCAHFVCIKFHKSGQN